MNSHKQTKPELMELPSLSPVFDRLEEGHRGVGLLQRTVHLVGQ
jgi:hypothetical protein